MAWLPGSRSARLDELRDLAGDDGKSYRLGKTAGDPPTGVEAHLPEVEAEFGIQAPAGTRFTRQEIDVAVFISSGQFASGFYLPAEDRFYLKPGTDLSDPRAQSTARHEMSHLLGGATQTQEAFRRRYGPDYQRYWRPFEEGMAEFVRTETQTPDERAAVAAGESSTEGSLTVTIEESPFYVASQQWIRRVIAAAPQNRQLLLNAYFTGNIPDAVFQLIADIPPPVPQ